MRIRSCCTSLVLVIGSLAGVGPCQAGDLQGQAAAIDTPTLGAVLEVEGVIAVGRGEIRPAESATVRELLAGGVRCGLVLDGEGVFSYRVEDRFSVPVARRNVERASKVKSGLDAKGALKTGTDLEGAVVWGWGFDTLAARDAAQAGAGDAAEAAAGVEEGLPEWVSKMLYLPFFSRPSNELLAAKALGGRDNVYALLKGPREDMLLVVDPLEDRMETLYRVEKIDNMKSIDYGRHFLEELAAQPIGRKWWERFPQPLVAVHESIQVDNDTGEHVKVTTTSTLQATRSGVGVWRSDLVQAVVDDETLNPNTVTSVKVNGMPADYLHQDHELLVVLDPPLASGAKVRVEVVNGGEIAIHPGGDTYFALGTWPWYPQPDLNGEFATIDIELRVPEGFTPFATGNRVGVETAEGHTVLRTRLDKPVQYPVLAAGRYNLYSDESNGVSCNVASYVFGNEKAANRLIQNFFAASQFYGELFGVPFPYQELDVVEINSWGFGQAPPGVIFITKEAFNPLGDYVSQFFSGGVNERYVHEVAHTWWGQIVKQDSVEEKWLSESFAEYSAALCLEAMKGGGKKGAREFEKILNGWKARTKLVKDGSSIYLAGHFAVHDDKDVEDRINLLYSKGPLVIHAIREELRTQYGGQREGDRYFVVLLGAVVKNFNFRWAKTADLIGILNQMTGRDWQPWFERYVYGCETPEVG